MRLFTGHLDLSLYILLLYNNLLQSIRHEVSIDHWLLF